MCGRSATNSRGAQAYNTTANNNNTNNDDAAKEGLKFKPSPH